MLVLACTWLCMLENSVNWLQIHTYAVPTTTVL